MLRLMLNEHSNIALRPQTKFLRKLYKRRMLFGDLNNGENIAKIIRLRFLYSIKVDEDILHKKDSQVIPIGSIHFTSPITPKTIHEIGSPNVMVHQSFPCRFFIAWYLALKFIN